MDFPQQALDLGQLTVLIAMLVKMFWRNNDKTENHANDIAVLKEKTKAADADHDKVVVLTEQVKKLELDLNRAYQTIRALQERKK